MDECLVDLDFAGVHADWHAEQSDIARQTGSGRSIVKIDQL